METYLLKFSACLAIFWLIYVLFLERQNMHHLKRFYLLGAVVLALTIPLLTITYYVEPILDLGTFDPYGYQTPPFIPIEILGSEAIIETPTNYLPILLWSIYGIGVLLFSIRFIVNLVKMYRRISGNKTVTQRSFIYVLLQELRIPHSFFNYVFLNKSKYEADAIPKEVILHEETHAKQLHSIDIIAIELLQIVFWFHPLIYILKHHIKLNHEFLADQAVLEEGIDTNTYQNILLQFSSPDSYRDTQDYQLSSAINYSSIKKRFTVMKTQTSKTRIWLSSLLLLPIISILFYSFAEREYVEKYDSEIGDAIKEELKEADKLDLISLDEYKNYLGIWYNEDEERTFQIHTQNGGLIWDVKDGNSQYVRYYPKKTESGWFFTYLNQDIKFEFENGYLNDSNGLIFQKINNRATSQNLLIELEDDGQLKVNHQLESPSSLYAHIETISKDLGNIEIKRLIKVTIFNKTNNGDRLLSEIISSLKSNGFNNPMIHDFKNNQPKKSKVGPSFEDTQEIYNPSFLEYIIEIANKGATFYLDGEKISAKEAKALAANSKSKRTDMITQKDIDGNFIVKLSSSKNNQSQQRITTIKINVDKEHNIILNGKPIKFENLAQKADELNSHLSKEDKKNYVESSILLPDNSFIDFSKKIMFELRKVNIYQNSTSYVSNLIKSGVQPKHFSLNSGLTVEEAKIKRKTLLAQHNDEQSLDQLIDSLNTNTNRKWSYTVESEFVDDNLIKTQEKASAKEVAGYNAWAKKIQAESKVLSANAKWYPPIDQQELIKFAEVYKRMSPKQKNQSIEFPFPGIDGKTIEQQIASKKQVEQYNIWAKKINTAMAKAEKNSDVNAYPIVKVKEVNKYKAIYNIMTEAQKKTSEPWPNFPPPPPPPPKSPKAPKLKKGYEEIPQPPPPPAPAKPVKKTKTLEKGLDSSVKQVNQEQKANSKKVLEAYAKKHPESVTQSKING